VGGFVLIVVGVALIGVARRGAETRPRMTTSGLVATLDAVLLVVVGQTLLKWGMLRVGPINRVRLRRPIQLRGRRVAVAGVGRARGLRRLGGGMGLRAVARTALGRLPAAGAVVRRRADRVHCSIRRSR